MSRVERILSIICGVLFVIVAVLCITIYLDRRAEANRINVQLQEQLRAAVKEINPRLASVEQQLSGIRGDLSQIRSELSDLHGQIYRLQTWGIRSKLSADQMRAEWDAISRDEKTAIKAIEDRVKKLETALALREPNQLKTPVESTKPASGSSKAH